MTTIAFDGKTVAADRMQTASGDHKRQTTKIWRAGEYIVSGAGSAICFQEFMAWFGDGMGLNPDKYPAYLRQKDTETVVCVFQNGLVREFYDSPFPCEVTDFPYAMGTGKDAAKAAMLCGKSPAEAIEIASKIDVWTGLGVDQMKVHDEQPTTSTENLSRVSESSPSHWSFLLNLSPERID